MSASSLKDPSGKLSSFPDYIAPMSPVQFNRINNHFPPLDPRKHYRGVYERCGFDVYKGEPGKGDSKKGKSKPKPSGSEAGSKLAGTESNLAKNFLKSLQRRPFKKAGGQNVASSDYSLSAHSSISANPRAFQLPLGINTVIPYSRNMSSPEMSPLSVDTSNIFSPMEKTFSGASSVVASPKFGESDLEINNKKSNSVVYNGFFAKKINSVQSSPKNSGLRNTSEEDVTTNGNTVFHSESASASSKESFTMNGSNVGLVNTVVSSNKYDNTKDNTSSSSSLASQDDFLNSIKRSFGSDNEDCPKMTLNDDLDLDFHQKSFDSIDKKSFNSIVQKPFDSINKMANNQKSFDSIDKMTNIDQKPFDSIDKITNIDSTNQKPSFNQMSTNLSNPISNINKQSSTNLSNLTSDQQSFNDHSSRVSLSAEFKPLKTKKLVSIMDDDETVLVDKSFAEKNQDKLMRKLTTKLDRMSGQFGLVNLNHTLEEKGLEIEKSTKAKKHSSIASSIYSVDALEHDVSKDDDALTSVRNSTQSDLTKDIRNSTQSDLTNVRNSTQSDLTKDIAHSSSESLAKETDDDLLGDIKSMKSNTNSFYMPAEKALFDVSSAPSLPTITVSEAAKSLEETNSNSMAKLLLKDLNKNSQNINSASSASSASSSSSSSSSAIVDKAPITTSYEMYNQPIPAGFSANTTAPINSRNHRNNHAPINRVLQTALSSSSVSLHSALSHQAGPVTSSTSMTSLADSRQTNSYVSRSNTLDSIDSTSSEVSILQKIVNLDESKEEVRNAFSDIGSEPSEDEKPLNVTKAKGVDFQHAKVPIADRIRAGRVELKDISELNKSSNNLADAPKTNAAESSADFYTLTGSSTHIHPAANDLDYAARNTSNTSVGHTTLGAHTAPPDYDLPSPTSFKSQVSEDLEFRAEEPKFPSGEGPCRKCQQDIQGKSIWSKDHQMSGRWHRACFSCYRCDQVFAKGTNCYVINDKPYCNYDFHYLNHSLCKICDSGIEGKCLENNNGERFHPDCLSCVKCGVFIVKDYFVLDGKPLCEKDGLYEIELERKALMDASTQNPHHHPENSDLQVTSKVEKRRTIIVELPENQPAA